VYEKINQRRLQDREKLDLLFNELLKLRHQVALNAGFDNFRDYMMRSMGRFDYTVADCEAFHEAIASEVIPLAQKIHAHRKKALGLDTLKPYDLEVETSGKHALTPFNGGDELVAKSLKSLGAVDAYFSDCIETMKVMGHLDLDSRIGKAPGGYNMPLPEIGVPFIFMNAAGIHRDVHVMVHEAGHAVHSFLTKDLAYDFDKNFGSEVAELASMSMELLTMEHWDSFYENEEDLQRAKTEQIESIITILPWIAIVDKFQHWIYTHPEHTVEERTAAWMDIHKKFASKEVDWSEYEAARSSLWQRQLHIFEVPFYYIEYGIAQLGALGVWRNSKENKTKAIADYKAALSLGNLVTIPEVYKTAGVPFDFSKENIASLMQMLAKELGI
jgi:oligoendopeptidase F